MVRRGGQHRRKAPGDETGMYCLPLTSVSAYAKRPRRRTGTAIGPESMSGGGMRQRGSQGPSSVQTVPKIGQTLSRPAPWGEGASRYLERPRFTCISSIGAGRRKRKAPGGGPGATCLRWTSSLRRPWRQRFQERFRSATASAWPSVDGGQGDEQDHFG